MKIQPNHLEFTTGKAKILFEIRTQESGKNADGRYIEDVKVYNIRWVRDMSFVIYNEEQSDAGANLTV